jgi:hypothetical protein
VVFWLRRQPWRFTKIPGLVSNQDDEVKKINDKVRDRRLVQAVIARKGPSGRAYGCERFRTRYSAAVIAVHRRSASTNAKIKLQAVMYFSLRRGRPFLTGCGK